ncbi:MAG: HEAT repeat domain-containing protein [Deltaproteobacteria bacterium]|nr:HEAT repeat domain-containing protein [Deltaproteobacteria bacterium]
MGGLFKNSKISFLLFKFFLEFAFSAGFFAATSLFITRVGTFSLFYIYFASSIIALGLSYFFSKIIDRYSRKVIFYGSFFTLGGLVLIGWALIQLFPEWKALYFAVRIYSYAVLVLTGLEFWVLASLTFTHADSKKVNSQLVVATILGEMAGGLFTGFASQWLGTESLLLLWGASLCIIPFLFVRFSFPRPETSGFSTGIVWGEVQAPGTGFRSRSFFSNRLIQLIFVFWIGYSFICYGSDYVFNSFAAERIQGEDELTAFFGKVSAAASLIVLCYHLLIAPKITERLGPAQNFILFAALMILPWILFIIHPSLVTIAIVDGIVFYFSDHFATGIHSSILTVFPERVKGRLRVLTEGFGRPLGTVLLFAVAALFAFQVRIEQMQYWMLAAAALFFLFPLLFRKPYGRHLLNCLHSRDPSLVLNSVQALCESPQTEAIAPLASILHDSKSTELRRSAVTALEHIRNPEAMKTILPILADPKNSLHSAAIDGLRNSPEFQGIYTLIGLLKNDQEKDPVLIAKSFRVLRDLLGKEVIVFFLGYLYDPNPQVQAAALKALAGFRDRRLIPIFLPFLEHADPRVRGAACVALHPFARTREGVRDKALAEIERLASSRETAERLAGLEAIGATRLYAYENLLENALRDPDKTLIWEAASALAQLKDLDFLQPYLLLLLDEDEGLAVAAGKRVAEFPRWSRRKLFDKIEELQDAQRAKIQIRLRKTHQDFSHDW